MTQTRQVIGEGEGHLVVTVKLAERWPLSANFFSANYATLSGTL